MAHQGGFNLHTIIIYISCKYAYLLNYLQEDVVPLTSCFHLNILNLADNHITTLNNTVDILAQLRRLEVLSLHVSTIIFQSFGQIGLSYHKDARFSDTQSLTNSADPDQTAPRGVV